MVHDRGRSWRDYIGGLYLRGAPQWFCSIAAVAVLLAIAKVGVGASIGSLMSMGFVANGLIGGVADCVLLGVVASGDKKMFTA